MMRHDTHSYDHPTDTSAFVTVLAIGLPIAVIFYTFMTSSNGIVMTFWFGGAVGIVMAGAAISFVAIWLANALMRRLGMVR